MDGKTKSKGGRPSKYTPELVAEICERVSKGEPLAVICREEGMPAHSTIWEWQKAMPSVSEAFARAREEGEEWIAAQCLEIADDTSEDFVKAKEGMAFDREHVQRSKLRIETRLKLLAKWNPKKWGDKVALEHTGANGGPVQTAQVDATALSDSTLQELLRARRANGPTNAG